MSLRRRLLILVPLALLVGAGGCKVNTINYFPPHPASVRVINLLPEATAIDVQVGGATAFTGVTFQSLTGYQNYDNQTTSFAVNVTGSTSPLLTFSFPLAGEQPYTLVVFGTLANPSATLMAEVASAPTNGNIQLAMFNAAINMSAMDVYVTAPGADITNLNPNYTYVAYNGASLNLAFAPGTYQIRVAQQGTKTVVYDSGGTVLTPNIALTAIMYTKGSGVLVNAIAPVMTETDLFKEMTQEHIDFCRGLIPMGRFPKIEELAAMVAWIASPECSFTTGAVFDLSGGRATY